MSGNDPYLGWVRGLEAALRAGAALAPPGLPDGAGRGGVPAAAPVGGRAAAGTPGATAPGNGTAAATSASGLDGFVAGTARGAATSASESEAPEAIIFAPHPDDEVIVGALALRLQRELGFRVTDVAVTLGSNRARRNARLRELEAACRALNFERVLPVPEGLSGINPAARESDPQNWAAAVEAVAAVLRARRPAVVMLPHAQDWNVTHTGTHLLVVEAMRQVPGLRCLTVETEFWGAMAAPNLMVESSSEEVAALVSALALHVGEVARNPYHLRLPAWMVDNVRRGAELVGGQGGAAPDFLFATLYRLRRWEAGDWRDVLPAGQAFGRSDSLAPLFGSA